jgi:hypothetical protein
MRYIANPVQVTAEKILAVDSALSDGTMLLLTEAGQMVATPEMTARMKPVIGDYVVTQSDGYVYLNPKDVFERKYRPEAKLSEQLDESLSYHRPSETQTARIEALRMCQKLYAAQLELLCPASRALSIAKTEFETSCMWAVKSIVLEKSSA